MTSLVIVNIMVSSDIVPGTVHLVDIAGNLNVHKRDGTNVILQPQPSSDPRDPLRWSNKKKHFQFTLLWIWAFLLAAILNFNGPIFGILIAELGWTGTQINIGVALGFMGLGVGVAFNQPLALKIGRRAVYLYCTLIGIIGTAIGARAQEYFYFYLYRTFAGWAASPVDTLVEVSACDIYFQHERSSKFGSLVLALYLGSYFPPVLSGFIADGIGWRWNYYILVILCAVLFIACFLFLEDTSFKRDFNNEAFENDIIEQIKSHALGEVSSTDKNGLIIENIESDSQSSGKSFTEKMKLIELEQTDDRSYFAIFIRPFFLTYYPAVLYGGAVYGSQMMWLTLMAVTQSAFFRAEPYNFSPSSVGLTNLGACVGCIFGMYYGGAFVDWLSVKLAERNDGIYEPEFRLWAMIVPTILNAAGIVAYGIGIHSGVHWAVPVVIGMGFMGFASAASGAICLTYAVDCYPKVGGEVLVVILVIRNAIGAGFTFGIEPWIERSGVKDTTWYMFLISILINGGFIFLIIFGKRIRRLTAQSYEKYSNPQFGEFFKKN